MSNSKESRQISAVKDKARRLQSILTPLLPTIKLGQCLDMCARLEGYRNWQTLNASLQNSDKDGFAEATMLTFITAVVVPAAEKICVQHGMSLKVSKDAPLSNTVLPGSYAEVVISPEGIDSCYWRVIIRVTATAVEFESGDLNFAFPAAGFAAAQAILTSRVLSRDMTPTLTRIDDAAESTVYWLDLDTDMSICSLSDPTKTIFNDTDQVMAEVSRRLNGILTGHKSLYEAFQALSRDWKNKRSITNFESAIWKESTGEPLYMAKSSDFHSVSFGPLNLTAYVGRSGDLHVSCGRDSAQLGVSSIMHLESEDEMGHASGYYIAKYGTDLRIHLNGLSKDDIVAVAREFGLGLPFEWQAPTGEFQEEAAFYESPAFSSLKKWVAANPLFAKRVAKEGGGTYLPDWYERIIEEQPAT